MTVVTLDKENRDCFRNLFSDGAWAGLEQKDVLGMGAVMDDGTPAGVLSLRMEGDRGELNWLYVDLPLRGIGAGSELVDILLQAAEGAGLRTIYAVFPTERMEDPALLSLLLDRGFQIAPTECGIITTTVGRLREGGLPKEASLEAAPLEKLPEEVKMAWLQEDPDRGPLEGYLPASRACLSGGQLQGLILFEEARDGGVILSSAWNRKGNPAVSQSLLAAGCTAVAAAYPPETPLYLETMDRFSRLLAGMIDPRAEEEPMYAVRLTLTAEKNEQEAGSHE